MTNDGTAKRPIRVISRHSTQAIADHHRWALERVKGAAMEPPGEQGTEEAVEALRVLGLSVGDDLTTRHERFRRLKWAVGVFV